MFCVRPTEKAGNYEAAFSLYDLIDHRLQLAFHVADRFVKPPAVGALREDDISVGIRDWGRAGLACLVGPGRH